MANPFKIIDRISEQKGAKPREILGWMLCALTSSHGLNAMQGKAVRRRTIIEEMLSAAQPVDGQELPASVMAAVDAVVGVQEMCDRMNVAGAKKDGAAEKNPDGFKSLERKLAAEQAARLILKELMNQTEHQMLKADIRLDAAIGPDGRIDMNKLGAQDDEDNGREGEREPQK